MTSPRRIRRTRSTALVLLLACLLAPLSLAASGDPCCGGMLVPCHGDPAPCATLAATPCCDVAPAAAQPAAERECSQLTLATASRAVASAVVPAAPPALAMVLVRLDSPPRLSVVLRN